MKTSFRMFATIAGVLVVAAVARAEAELDKPMAIVSLASYDEQMANLDFLGQLGGQQNASQLAENMLQMFTQGQGLKGLDKSKPWGLVIFADGDAHLPMAFLPVASAKEFTDALAMVIGPAQEDGDGVLKISPPGKDDIFIREKDGWAFVTDLKYDGSLPDDPAKLLSGLNTEYDIAARAYLQNIPQEMKDKGLEQLKGLMEFAAMMQGRGDEATAELQRKSMEQQMKALERFVDEADQVTVGWKIDEKAQNTHLDFTVTAMPDSQLAEDMAKAAEAKSDFVGFLRPDAAVNFLFAGERSAADIEQALTMLASVREKAELEIDNDSNLDDDAREQVKTVLRQLFDVAEQTVKTGKSDVGGAVMLGPEKLQAAVGGFVADGPALESAVKNLIELAKGEADFEQKVTVKFDVENYNGVRFHQAMIDLPDDEHCQKVFGDTLDLYLGIGPQSAYLAAGKDGLSFVKSIIDDSKSQAGKQVLPMQITVALGPIFEFAASIKPDGPAAMLAEQLAELKGKDRVLFTAKPISDGMTARLEIEDGVLQAISAFTKLKAVGPGPGAAPEPEPEPEPEPAPLGVPGGF